MQDIPVLRLYVALCVEALYKVAVGAYRVEHLPAHAGHDAHIQNNIDRVGHFNAVAREGRAYDAHGIGNDVHRPAVHGAAGDLVCKFVRLPGVHPVVVGTRVIAVFSANKGSVLHSCNVVHLSAVKVAIGQKAVVQLDKLAGIYGLFSQLVDLLLTAVYPHDIIGLGKICALFDEGENFFISRKCHFLLLYFLHKNKISVRFNYTSKKI